MKKKNQKEVRRNKENGKLWKMYLLIEIKISIPIES